MMMNHKEDKAIEYAKMARARKVSCDVWGGRQRTEFRDFTINLTGINLQRISADFDTFS